MVERITQLENQVEQLTTECEEYRSLYLKTLEQCRKLELGILGQKAERLEPDDAQLTLSILNALLSKHSTEQNTEQTIGKQSPIERERCKPTGRKPLPDHLPRVDIEILPNEVKRDGLDTFEKIGQEVTETLERRAASLVVVRITRPTFVRKDREKNAETEVYRGETAELPIERGLAGPGLLAQTLVQRWQDHLPLHRLESIYRREGIELARSTICGWHMSIGSLCQSLYDAMLADAMSAPFLCTDATGVLVQAKHKCKNGHFWVVLAPEKHALFAYSQKHNSEAVDVLLADYQGYLVCDAHTVYDHLYRDGDILEVGCWAHTRRYFYKALGSDPDRAHFALALINGLFRIERNMDGRKAKEKKKIRNDNSRPLLEKFFAWADEQATMVLSDTPIAKAIGYARNQRDALCRFTEDGRLPIHNNSSERQLRREAIGRKNWLFVGSDEAGQINATMVSLLASCQIHKLEPWQYLRDLLCLLPAWPNHRVLELAPAYFTNTLKQQETQEILTNNLYRRALLGDFDPHPDTG